MIISMLYTIQMMEPSVRVSFGDSNETYGGSEWQLPPHGIIQGNSASPLILATISTVLFLSLNEKYGGVLHAPITKTLTTLAGFTFVDNTDILQTQHHSHENLEDIVDELQGSLNV